MAVQLRWAVQLSRRLVQGAEPCGSVHLVEQMRVQLQLSLQDAAAWKQVVIRYHPAHPLAAAISLSTCPTVSLSL